MDIVMSLRARPHPPGQVAAEDMMYSKCLRVLQGHLMPFSYGPVELNRPMAGRIVSHPHFRIGWADVKLEISPEGPQKIMK